MESTYILTAELDHRSFAWLDELRRRHFPPDRNFLPAHLTLFHRLSAAQACRLRSLPPRVPVAVRFDRVVFLGFGVAVHVQSAELERVRGEIKSLLDGEFSRQDSQPWKPHVTIQNKVAAETARELHRQILEEFSERAGAATALLVWEYLGGPWRLAERIALTATARASQASSIVPRQYGPD